MLNTEIRKVEIKFVSPMLGTVAKDPEIYKNYIATKGAKARPDQEEEIEAEAETVDDEFRQDEGENLEERGWTGFHKDENGLFIYDYMVRGFLKSALETLIENGAVKKIPAYKKWIDRLVFVRPRRLYFGKDEPDFVSERALRVITRQGPRVTIARSDAVDTGTMLSFELELFSNKKGLTFDVLSLALAYGRYVGLGQWRGSGGFGQFEVVETKNAA
jgi:hypothetical protein